MPCGKSCIYELHECCGRQRHEGSLICSSFSYFFRWGINAKNGKWSSQGHSWTRTRIWIFKTTALFIPLLWWLRSFQIDQIGQSPLVQYPPILSPTLFKRYSQNLSKEEKNTKKICLLYQSAMLKKHQNLCPKAHWPSLMPPEAKVFIANSPRGSKYHLTLNFFLLWQSQLLPDHILLELSTFSSNKIQLYKGTHPGCPRYSKQFTRVGKCRL